MGKTWTWAFVGMLWFVACGGEDAQGSTAPIRIRIEQDVSIPLLVPRNETFTIDVWTEYEDGTPAEGAVLQWLLYGGREALVNKQSIEPGHDRLIIGPIYKNTLVDLISRVCPDGDYSHCDGGAVAEFKSVRTIVHGGFPGTRMVHGPLDVSVGERRPIRLAAVASEYPGSPLSFLTDRDVGMSSSDGRVLETDGLVIEGREPGTVMLTLTGPNLTESVEVRVRSAEEAPLRKLENEALLLGGGTVLGTNAGMLMPRGSMFESITFDGGNNPVILARVGAPTALVHTTSEHVDTVLARWTGTGWGAEAPFKDWMRIYFPVMVKDERNHVYVGAFDRNRGMFVIADRELDDLGGAFEYHYIPAPSWVVAEGLFPEQSVLGIDRGGGRDQQSVSNLSDWITLHPKRGGGVHFAVTPSYETNNCERVLMVGALDANGALTHEEREVYEWMKNANGNCDWIGPSGVPNGEVHWEPPTTPGGEPTVSTGRSYRSAPSEAWSTRTIDGAPAPGLEATRLSNLVPGQYRFDDGDRMIVAGVAGVGIRTIDAYGKSSVDNAAEVLFGNVSGHVLQRLETWVSGIGSQGSTFASVHQGDGISPDLPLVTVVTLPPALPLDGDEETGDGLAGLRIGRIASPAPVTSLEILPDGRRVGLAVRLGFESALRFSWPGVYRSDAAGAPWEPVEDRVFEAFDPEHPLRRQGSTLYTMSHNLAGLILANLHVSTDGGDTWTTEGIFNRIEERKPLVAHIFPNGVRLVVSGQPLSGRPTMHLQLRDEGAVSWRDTNQWMPPTLTFWNQYEAAAVEAADGSLTVATIAAAELMIGMTQRYHLITREYDAEGEFVRSRDVIVPPGVRLHTATRLPDGDLLFFGGTYGERYLPVTYSVRVDAETDTAVQTMLPTTPELYVHAPGVVLDDGTLVVGGDRVGFDGPVNARYVRCMYMTSMDGATFSEPVDLRPAGGRAQVTYALAKEPDGEHVVFVVGDSATLWSLRDYAFGYADRERANALTAPLVPMSVRVAP